MTEQIVEDLGNCIGCNQPILIGQPVTPWDDEIGHYNCKDPFSLSAQPDLDDDAEIPPALVMLGNPALYVSLPSVRALLEKQNG